MSAARGPGCGPAVGDGLDLGHLGGQLSGDGAVWIGMATLAVVAASPFRTFTLTSTARPAGREASVAVAAD
jgi:hypothetical protein